MNKKTWITTLILIAIVLLAAGYRFYDIVDYPPGLAADQAAAGEDALLILEGDLKPFYPRDGGREALFFYVQAPFIKIFGTDVWPLLAASAAVGVATVLAMFFATRVYFGRLSGLLAAFFLATSYWHVTLSRSGWREIMIPLLILVFTALLGYTIKAVKDKRLTASYVYATLTGLVFGAGFYAHASFLGMAGVLGGVLCLMLLAAMHPNIGFPHFNRYWRQTAAGLAASFLVLLPLIIYLAPDPGSYIRRAEQVSVFKSDMQSQHGGETPADGVIPPEAERAASTIEQSGQQMFAVTEAMAQGPDSQTAHITRPGTIQPGISVGQPTDIIFTSRFSGTASSPTNIELYHTDAQGNILSMIGTLFDDGEAGVSIAGDNIFTGTFEIVADAPGALHYKVIAEINGYSIESDLGVLYATTFPIDTNLYEDFEVVNDGGVRFIANQLLVRFEDGTDEDRIKEIVHDEGGKIIGSMPWLRYIYVGIDNLQTWEQMSLAIERFEAYEEFTDATPNTVGSFTPVNSSDSDNVSKSDEYGGGLLLNNTRTTLLSFFVGEGDSNWRHSVAGYPLLNPLVGVMFLLGFAWVIHGTVVVALNILKGTEIHYGMIFPYILLLFIGMLLPVILTAGNLPDGLLSAGLLAPIFLLAGVAASVSLYWIKRYVPLEQVKATLYGLVVGLLILSAAYDGILYFGIARNDADAHFAYRSDLTEVAEYINNYDSVPRPYLVLDEFSAQTIHYLTSVAAHDHDSHPDERDHQYELIDPDDSYKHLLQLEEVIIFTQSTIEHADRYEEVHGEVLELVESRTNRFGREIMRVYKLQEDLEIEEDASLDA